MTTTDTLLAGPEFAAWAGITYRQLYYWVRQGVLVPAVASTGSGSRMFFEPSEVAVAGAVVPLASLGTFGGADTTVLRGVAAVVRANPKARWVRLDLSCAAAVVDAPAPDGALYLSVRP